LFQFHAGSIKGRSNASQSIPQGMFQFHAGSIKGSGIPPYPFLRNVGFNSTLVRLKAAKLVLLLNRLILFQFHAGSIKGIACLQVFDVNRHVSIPRWFD